MRAVIPRFHEHDDDILWPIDGRFTHGLLWSAGKGPPVALVWTWQGLVTYYTVFVIDLASRRVHVLASTPHPSELFMTKVVLTPARAPNANAYAERFVRSIKAECLDCMIPLGERHFRRAIMEFVEHYHLERNHQGLDNRLITRRPTADTAGRVRRRSRLGGLLNYYERVA